MNKRMLVLLDGSDLAEVVLDYAQELAGRLGIDLELLHVADPHDADRLRMHRGYIEHMTETLRARAEDSRSRCGAQASAVPVQARGTVRVGRPADEILAYLDENDVDLVMMSTHGRSGPREHGIGGVANKVVHESKVPVWLVPSEVREQIICDTLDPRRPLVIPLSGSTMSESAVSYGLNLVAQRNDRAQVEFVLLHVLEAPSIAYPRSGKREQKEKRGEMAAYLEGVAERVRAAGHEVRLEILGGDPAETVVDYIKANPPQLLAMATRGHTGLSRMVFGSVAEHVIHMIKKTPMLLVPGGSE